MRLFPTDDAYYPMLSQMAGFLTEATDQLDRLLADIAHAGPISETVRQIEKRADDLPHEIVSRLSHTFMTPFDRQEIYEVA